MFNRSDGQAYYTIYNVSCQSMIRIQLPVIQLDVKEMTNIIKSLSLLHKWKKTDEIHVLRMSKCVFFWKDKQPQLPVYQSSKKRSDESSRKINIRYSDFDKNERDKEISEEKIEKPRRTMKILKIRKLEPKREEKPKQEEQEEREEEPSRLPRGEERTCEDQQILKTVKIHWSLPQEQPNEPEEEKTDDLENLEDQIDPLEEESVPNDYSLSNDPAYRRKLADWSKLSLSQKIDSELPTSRYEPEPDWSKFE